MSRFGSFFAVGIVALLAVCTPVARAGLTTPSPYLSFVDSPFAGGIYQYFYLEDFEDGALNTPGVSASGGFVLAPSALSGQPGLTTGPGYGTLGAMFLRKNWPYLVETWQW
jgi:hypothetical protein